MGILFPKNYNNNHTPWVADCRIMLLWWFCQPCFSTRSWLWFLNKFPNVVRDAYLIRRTALRSSRLTPCWMLTKFYLGRGGLILTLINYVNGQTKMGKNKSKFLIVREWGTLRVQRAIVNGEFVGESATNLTTKIQMAHANLDVFGG